MQDGLSPTDGRPNATLVPNAYLDRYFPQMDDTQLRVMLALVRQHNDPDRHTDGLDAGEIAERALLSDPEDLILALFELHQLGLVVDLDDGRYTIQTNASQVHDHAINAAYQRRRGVSDA